MVPVSQCCLCLVVAGQTFVVQDGSSVVRPAVEAGGGAKDGELQPETGAAGQLQPPDQAGDRGL